MKHVVPFLFLAIMPSFLAWGNPPPDGMVLVPAGEFTMGTDDAQAPADQHPAQKVYLEAFYIDIHEVTNAQFEEFILAGGYNKRQYWTQAGWEFIQKELFYYIYPGKQTYRIEAPLGFRKNSVSIAPEHPVIGVSWYEASAYAKWAGKRLLTGAEWEKAARGTDARIYPWGNEFDFSKLNYFPHQTKLMPVGSFSTGASPFGVMDMAGSVAEWCADEVGVGLVPTQFLKKTVRGGGWNSIRLTLRCTHQEAELPTHRHYTLGFRCAKSVK